MLCWIMFDAVAPKSSVAPSPRATFKDVAFAVAVNAAAFNVVSAETFKTPLPLVVIVPESVPPSEKFNVLVTTMLVPKSARRMLSPVNFNSSPAKVSAPEPCAQTASVITPDSSVSSVSADIVRFAYCGAAVSEFFHVVVSATR